MSDYPHVTVATVVENDGKFLMVKERSEGELVVNQPAGHLELGESLLEAAVRETLEETTWQVELTAFLGIYHFNSKANNVTYVRHCFVAKAVQQVIGAKLDADIEQTCWLSPEQIRNSTLRSPLVQRAVDDYYNKPKHDLSIFRY